MIRQIDDVKAVIAAPDSENADPAKVWGQLSAIMADHSGTTVPVAIEDLITDAMDSHAATERIGGVGVPEVDREIHLFEPGELTILAARPGVGKSSFMRQLIWNASASGPALVFSLEVTPKVLTQQLTCEAAEVPYESWRNTPGNEDFMMKIVDAMESVAKRPIYMFPRPTVTSLDVVLAVTQMSARGKHPIMITIDYLGLMKHEKSERQDLAIGATTRALKLMALEKKVPVLLLCQMNRQSEQRGTAKEYDRPRLADLRDSGSIEQDADNILFLWRKDRDEYSTPVVGRTLTIAKRRNGSVFESDLLFDKPKGRFISSRPIPVDEMSGVIR
jgi:replicative DNA helicase